MAAIQTELLPAEPDSLRRLTCGTVKKRIPAEHSEKLVRCGFAKNQAGTLIITIRGHAKLAFELTGASWFATPI
ncbi:MAG: hypothetical protein OEP48_05170 [Betaproteobacteria bacterium]|nr:hypothetical protein [Betaproteobacteria bacterium]MDH3437279.1 hypothetical protein [Betaproteobacteria bacterium]